MLMCKSAAGETERSVVVLTGEAERAHFPAAVQLWSILLLLQTQGAGDPQHHLDC